MTKAISPNIMRYSRHLQSRVVDMDSQLATEKSVCDLLNENLVFVWWVSLDGFTCTYDSVLNKELFFEVVVNLFGGHNESGKPIDETRR